MKTVYLVIGCPGSGKTTICEKLSAESLYHHVPHDEFKDCEDDYVDAILYESGHAKRPLLAEAPFSISRIKDPLEREGLTVVPVFILEEPEVISGRYRSREGRDIPPGHLTRQKTYAERCSTWDAFSGTADEVLGHLRAAARAA